MVIIGVGNEWRQDDGAGIEVARQLRETARHAGVEVRQHPGEPSGLLEQWRGADAVVLVDTMHSELPTGTFLRLDASRAPLVAGLEESSSTHSFALGEAIELGRALGRLPRRVIVYAVEGERFEMGTGFSESLTAAIPLLTEAVLGEAMTMV